MNLLTYHLPTHILLADACKQGLGRYSANGLSWRCQLPDHLISRAHINLLEFLASILGIWLEILTNGVTQEVCLLCMSDNSTSTGWLRKSNFQEEDESSTKTTVKLIVARNLATLLIDTNTMLYSQ